MASISLHDKSTDTSVKLVDTSGKNKTFTMPDESGKLLTAESLGSNLESSTILTSKDIINFKSTIETDIVTSGKAKVKFVLYNSTTGDKNNLIIKVGSSPDDTFKTLIECLNFLQTVDIVLESGVENRKFNYITVLVEDNHLVESSITINQDMSKVLILPYTIFEKPTMKTTIRFKDNITPNINGAIFSSNNVAMPLIECINLDFGTQEHENLLGLIGVWEFGAYRFQNCIIKATLGKKVSFGIYSGLGVYGRLWNCQLDITVLRPSTNQAFNFFLLTWNSTNDYTRNTFNLTVTSDTLSIHHDVCFCYNHNGTVLNFSTNNVTFNTNVDFTFLFYTGIGSQVNINNNAINLKTTATLKNNYNHVIANYNSMVTFLSNNINVNTTWPNILRLRVWSGGMIATHPIYKNTIKRDNVQNSNITISYENGSLRTITPNAWDTTEFGYIATTI